MEVYQLVYTKVAPEESPFRKRDFHTVFYPIDLLSPQDVYEIERRIHFPGADWFKSKETIFYQNIKNENYLVVLHMRNLPEETDTYGRRGIFLCHGFLFPPQIWQKIPTPLQAFELVKEFVFKNRAEIFASPLIERSTGNIQPLEISSEKIDELNFPLPQISDFEIEMALLLNRISRTVVEGRPPLLIKGEPEDISQFLNRIVAYVPDELKINIGWDSVLDGGNLNFYPLKIAGYRDNPPIGGNPIQVDLKAGYLNLPTDISHLTAPQTPYEKWLAKCYREIANKSQIEGAYKLSLFLTSEKVSLSLEDKEIFRIIKRCFVSANGDEIRNVFRRRFEERLGAGWVDYILPYLSAESMFELMMEDFPPKILSEDFEKAILEKNLTPKGDKLSIPASIVEEGSKLLKVIDKLWREGKVDIEGVRSLNTEDKEAITRYILLTEWKDKEWVIELLKDEAVFRKLIGSSETRIIIWEILSDNFIFSEKEFKGVGEILRREIKRAGREFDLLMGRVDFLEVIENYLRRGKWGEEEFRKLLAWGKGFPMPEGDYLYIKAFLYPREAKEAVKKVLKEEAMREMLLEILKRFHHFKPKELEELGIKIEEEVKEEGKFIGEGFIKRIRRFFQRGK